MATETQRVKLSLREFQAQLTERLQAASGHGAASKLGFIAGQRHWLVDLSEINEVVTVAEIMPVPWAKPWFVGLTSVRGSIYGCTDLAAFHGKADTPGRGESRLLLVHPRFGLNAALRVERTLGLRNPADFKAIPAAAGDATWIRGRWRGPDTAEWLELNMEQLVASPEFMDAGE